LLSKKNVSRELEHRPRPHLADMAGGVRWKLELARRHEYLRTVTHLKIPLRPFTVAGVILPSMLEADQTVFQRVEASLTAKI
jgi:hypothetical protein